MSDILGSMPKIITGQYEAAIGSYKLYYNPTESFGVTVVDAETQSMLNLCDGHRELSNIVKLCNRDTETAINEFVLLANRNVVDVGISTSKSSISQVPKNSISCWLHLTNSCNLACTYCYIHKSPGDMSWETATKIIDNMLYSCEVKNIPIMNIKFAGGEPLMKFSFMKDVVEYCRKNQGEINITFTVLTNATLMTPEIAQYLRENKIGVGVSLDGIGEVNDRTRIYRNGRGSFDKTVAGIKILRDAGIIPNIMTTVSSGNFRELDKLTEFFIENNYKFRFSLERDGSESRTELLELQDELIEVLNRCYDYVESNLPEEDFMSLHTFGDVNFRRPAKRSCGAGNNYFACNQDGKIGLCGMGLADTFSHIDSMSQSNLIDEVRSINRVLISKKATEYQGCSSCVWNRSCAGGCSLQTFATFGRYDTSSPYCKVYRAVLPRVLVIRGMQMIRDYEDRIKPRNERR